MSRSRTGAPTSGSRSRCRRLSPGSPASSVPEAKMGSRQARPPVSRRSPAVAKVIFDWGGTLTPWHDIDFAGEAEDLPRAVVAAEGDPADHAALLQAAADTAWGRSRDHQQSATLAWLFAEAGLDHDPALL